MYRTPELVIAKYRRIYFIVAAVGIALVALSLLGGATEFLRPRDAVIIGIFGGIGCGIGFMYRSFSTGIPFQIRYTKPHEEAVEARIAQLRKTDVSPQP